MDDREWRIALSRSSILNPRSSNEKAREAQRAERWIRNREVASSTLAAGFEVKCYGEDSSDHHRDAARALHRVAQEGACAQAHDDKAESSSRLDSSDGRAPIS